MKKSININQNVAVLCDGNNIELSIHSESKDKSTMINFDTLIPRLLNGRGLNRLIYFREGVAISDKFADRLHQNFYGSVIPCHKTADIPLSIKATQLASKVDTIIIMSGDSDFIELVRHLKAEGVRVEIAAVKSTTSAMLIKEADYFHSITKNDWFVYNSRNRNNSNKSNNTKVKKTNTNNQKVKRPYVIGESLNVAPPKLNKSSKKNNSKTKENENKSSKKTSKSGSKKKEKTKKNKDSKSNKNLVSKLKKKIKKK
jgi:uncharacterized LabA/DUF88 family protein